MDYPCTCSSEGYAGTWASVQKCLPVDPVVHDPRGLLVAATVIKSEEHSDSTSVRSKG